MHPFRIASTIVLATASSGADGSDGVVVKWNVLTQEFE